MLISVNESIKTYLLEGIEISKETSYQSVIHNPTLSTALIPYVGYKKASEIASLMKEKNIDVFEANKLLKIIENQKIHEILKPENLLRLGFSLND